MASGRRFDMAQGSAVALPLEWADLDQSRRPALAEIIGTRRMWTVAMISSGSIP